MQIIKKVQILGIVFLLTALVSCDVMGNSMKLNDFFNKETIALVRAIERDKEDQALSFIEKGVPLNIHGKEGITPLLWLIMKKDKAGMRLALKLGADPNFPSPNGDTPVTMTAGANDDDFLEILLEAGGDPNATNRHGYRALFEAIGESRMSQVEMLIKFGADIALTDKSGRNPAMYAANLNKFEYVHFFLEQGLDHKPRSSTNADLAWGVHDSLSMGLMDTKSSTYEWAIKVKQKLIDLGVEFPPPSPQEVRWTEGIPNQFDIEARDEKIEQGIPLESYERPPE